MRLFAIGEALIDFLPENSGYIPVVGGAPANVAACFARLGGKAYFIGKVGEDLFGKKIVEALQAAGVRTDYVTATDKANTALSFVTLDANGERHFSFYRNPSADMLLSTKDIEKITFHKDDILHFCSVDLIDMPVRYATVSAIKKVRLAGGTVSFDPNVRKSLWKDLVEYKSTILNFLPEADIVKLSEEECQFLFGDLSIEKVAEILLQTAKTVLITLGENGSRCFNRDREYTQQAFKIMCLDTTGAGDTFIGTFLRFFEQESIAAALQKAAAASAIVCTKKGVFNSLPDAVALEEFLRLRNV
ncbi:MAG: carbohydrate kinase [Clostridia bacterium]|nr:carbohydrate kinase [Clostridia bacterium]